MRVIARAYGDEPLDRIATGRASGVTYILNPSTISSTGIEPNSGVGFPDRFVFRFDQSLWERLWEAWEHGNTDDLLRLWDEASPIEACELVDA